ncbi:MAG TPA: hypothetical protein VEK79_26075 [Thermoanaerobaculia bacterium]|nr:hypothetical protein [Thermoanaerobaculia bacterium]
MTLLIEVVDDPAVWKKRLRRAIPFAPVIRDFGRERRRTQQEELLLFFFPIHALPRHLQQIIQLVGPSSGGTVCDQLSDSTVQHRLDHRVIANANQGKRLGQFRAHLS